MSNNPIISCQSLSKSFHDAKMHVDVLHDVNFEINIGERVAIVGASGSGKSTLLHLLGGLDKPTSGQVIINGENISALSESKKSRFRNKNLGFVYQFHHLLPEFTAVENVAMPLMLAGKDTADAIKQSIDMLSRVGLEQRLKHKPSELSGGERQRAAIARALVSKPRCVLADEPTGNLDSKTATKVYDMMLELNIAMETSFVVVTHDESLANKMDRIMRLEEGTLVTES